VKPHSAQGWYRDPFEAHEDRYFSAGEPTKLVRDGGHEAYDEPPDRPYVASELVPVQDDDDFSGSDLRRADEAERRSVLGDLRRADDKVLDRPYTGEEAEVRALDAFAQSMPPN